MSPNPTRVLPRLLCACLLFMAAFAALPAAAAGPADILKGRKIVITGGTVPGAGLGQPDREAALQSLGESAATTVGANLAQEHQLGVNLFPEQPGGEAGDAALAARVKATGAERLIVLIAVARPDRRVEVVAQVYEVRFNALGALDSERLWQGSTAVTFTQISTRAPWLAATLIGYDLLDAMVGAQLLTAPAPPDRLVADMLFDCAAIHHANALALKASGDNPDGQQKLVDYYSAAGKAFSSAQYATQKTAETTKAVREAMDQATNSSDTDAARDYLAELDARIEHCGRYQQRHLGLIDARLKPRK